MEQLCLIDIAMCGHAFGSREVAQAESMDFVPLCDGDRVYLLRCLLGSGKPVLALHLNVDVRHSDQSRIVLQFAFAAVVLGNELVLRFDVAVDREAFDILILLDELPRFEHVLKVNGIDPVAVDGVPRCGLHLLGRDEQGGTKGQRLMHTLAVLVIATVQESAALCNDIGVERSQLLCFLAGDVCSMNFFCICFFCSA